MIGIPFKKTIFCLLLAVSTRLQVDSQLIYADYVYEPNIKSVQFYRESNENAFPVLYLGDNDAKLNLEFDQLLDDQALPENLSVAFVNCLSNWEPSDIQSFDFTDQFTFYSINEWRSSQNTRIPYVHYTYSFSLASNGLKRSGNYLLYVYRQSDPEAPIISRRFIIEERKVSIVPKLGQSYSVGQRNKLQSLAFDLFPGSVPTTDPARELEVYILQNGRWDNVRGPIRPTFVTPDKLEFMFDASVEFQGGNEFRMLDIRSTRFRTAQVKTIEDHDSIWYYELFTDETRSKEAYTLRKDLNGGFIIAVQEYQNADWQADYVMVHFSVSQPDQLKDRDVFVSGRLSNYQNMGDFQMAYNTMTQRYETEVLLKNGVYDYKYVVVPKKTRTPDETFFEGSFYETENFYTILVYYRGIIERSHRLVGMTHINYWDR